MAAIANVVIGDTFQIWLTRTNQSLVRLNEFAINESVLYANTVHANNALTVKGQDSDARYANTSDFLSLQSNTNSWISTMLEVANAVATYAPLVSPAFTGNTTFDTDTLFIDAVNDRVGVNTTPTSTALHVGGKITANPTEILTIANSAGSVVKTINGFTST